MADRLQISHVSMHIDVPILAVIFILYVLWCKFSTVLHFIVTPICYSLSFDFHRCWPPVALSLSSRNCGHFTVFQVRFIWIASAQKLTNDLLTPYQWKQIGARMGNAFYCKADMKINEEKCTIE